MEKQDNQQTPKDLGNPKPKMSLSKLYLWIGSFVALTAAIFGTLADGKSVLSGCNTTEVPRQMERVDVSKLTFKKYQGRYGCSFLYPADWEIGIDNPAGDREIRHPTNPEISIVYADMYYPVHFESIQEVGEQEGGFIKESNGRTISHTYHKQYYDNCDRAIEFGKIVFSMRSNREKTGIRIYTKLDNDLYYALTMECPERDYDSYKELMRYIIASIEFDCSQMENEF